MINGGARNARGDSAGHRANPLGLDVLVAVAVVALLVGGFPLGCAAVSAPVTAPPSSPAASSAPSAASAATPPLAAPTAPTSPRAPQVAAATEHPAVTQAAMDVLERGGTAADAAIAAALTAGVVQPVSSGLGGDGFALVWDAPTQKLDVVDFRGTAPIGIRPSHYLTMPPPPAKRGVLVPVPGEPAGLFELHRRYGKTPFAELCRGAADLADKGFAIGPHMRRVLAWNRGWLDKTPRAAPWSSVLGAATPDRDVASPALAKTLRKLAAEGRDGFYRGSIAADVVATARAAGSRIIADDLAKYQAIGRAPLVVAWEGRSVATVPPPSAGGVAVAQALAMFDRASLRELGFQSGASVHLLAEASRASIADRLRWIGDPDFVKTDVPALVSASRMKARRAELSLTATRRPEDFGALDAGTSHLVVVDAAGSIVSLTTSVGSMFGSRLFTESGFVLSDSLDDFTHVEVATRFGGAPGPNAPRGGARPVSSMSPVIVLEGGRPVLALGASGGSRITSAVVQVLLARLAHDREVDSVVSELRFDAPPNGGLVLDEGAPDPLVADLVARGEVVSRQRSFDAVQLVGWDDEGGASVLRAAADPRKDGSAVVR